MASAWYLFATIGPKQTNYDSWAINIYKYSDTTITSLNYKLMSDLMLRRGNANRKEKMGGFTYTQISFLIKDQSNTIYNLMAGASDGEFKAVIKKNGSVWFTGNVLLMTSKKDISSDDNILKLKVYDGLNRLKNFNDFSSMTDKLSINETFRNLLNALDFNIDIHYYSRCWVGSVSAGGSFPGESQYIYIEDYLGANSNATYYDILNYLCKQLNLEIFQDEGVWIIRQIISMNYVTSILVDGIIEVIIDYSTGSTSKTAVSQNQNLTTADLASAPVGFLGNRYKEIIYEINYYEAKLKAASLVSKNLLEWVNGYFEQGSKGWTVVSGVAHFYPGMLEIEPTGEVVQLSGDLSASSNVKISFKTTCVRMILADSDRLYDSDAIFDIPPVYDNPLVEIAYEGTSNTYYLNRATLLWETSDDDNKKFGVGMQGIVVDSNYQELYTVAVLEKEIDIQVPAEAGKIKIHLYGGGAVSGNNYPGEASALHHYAVVEKKITNNQTYTTPQKGIIKGSLPSAAIEDKSFYFNVPFHDLDVYSNVSFWLSVFDYYTGLTYERTKEWTTPAGTIPIAEAIVEYLIKYHRDMNGFDIRLLPGTSMKYNNIIYCNLDGEGTKYFLPIYEEAALIEDRRRFVILQHELSSDTVTIERYFE